MISSNTVYLKVAKESIGGNQNLNATQTIPKLTEKELENKGKARITEDEYIAMEQFAKLLPRGNRQLRLNLPELKDEMLSNPKLEPMTDTSGLKTGGIASVEFNGNAKKSVKKIKEMKQKDFKVSIKNNNRVTAPENYSSTNLNGYNPDYTSFKNNFILR